MTIEKNVQKCPFETKKIHKDTETDTAIYKQQTNNIDRKIDKLHIEKQQ